MLVVQPAGKVPGAVVSNDSLNAVIRCPNGMLKGTTPKLLAPS